MSGGGNAWWYVFVSAFVVIAFAETFLPFRSLPSSTPRRWTSNSVLLLVSSAVVFCAYQLTGVAVAVAAQAASRGLLNRVALAAPLRFGIGFVALDLTAYGGHRLYHRVGLLWRVHRVHHSETDLDLTTGLRFHPAEALLAQGLLLAAIALLGISPAAVAFAAFAMIVQDFFSHANFRLPGVADRVLRLVFVTPAMHRIHHSDGVHDQNTNFGTIFSWWDRLFGTYRATPARGAETRYGVVEINSGSRLGGGSLLALPFRRPPKT